MTSAHRHRHRHRRRAPRVARTLACALGLLACARVAGAQARPVPESACACTQSFALVMVQVVSTGGQPVSDARVRVRQLRTGREVDAQPGPAPGSYVVVDDSWRGRLRPGGEVLRVSAGRDAARSTARLRVGVPGRCRCHVQRIAGPDTLVLR